MMTRKHGSRSGKDGRRSGKSDGARMSWTPPKVPKTFRGVKEISYGPGTNRYFIQGKRFEEYEVLEPDPELLCKGACEVKGTERTFKTCTYCKPAKCRYERVGHGGIMTCRRGGDGYTYRTDPRLVRLAKEKYEIEFPFDLGMRWNPPKGAVGVNPESLHYSEAVSSDSHVRRLMELMKEGEPFVPVVIDTENNVLDGHHRVEAARRLGIGIVPAVRVEYA